jgi:hypothetical protein
MATSVSRRIGTVAASLAVVIAYWAIVVTLNRPPAAHSTRTVSSGATTTTIPELAVGNEPAAITTTTLAVPLVQPGPLHAPTFGTYPIHVTTNSQTTEGTLVVGRDGSQRITIGDAKRAVKLRWSTTKGELLRTGEARADGSCAWNPAVLAIAANLTEDKSWSSDVTCVTSSGDDTITIRRQDTAKVMQRVRTQVAGVQLDAWLIERHVITTSRGPGLMSVTEEAVSELFAPKIGLDVYTLRRTDTPRPDGGVDSVLETIELGSATPL